jgi:hypothetical protein
LSSVRDTTQAWARNPINGLSAPQGLVGLVAGYQTRPTRLATKALANESLRVTGTTERILGSTTASAQRAVLAAASAAATLRTSAERSCRPMAEIKTPNT